MHSLPFNVRIIAKRILSIAENLRTSVADPGSG